MLGFDAIQFDEDERRAGDVGEHAGHAQRTGQHVADEEAITEQPQILPERTGHRLTRQPGRIGFRQPERDRHQAHRAEQRQQDEDRRPAERRQQRAARHRREDRRQAHHQHQLREHLGAGHRVAQVTHHGTRYHHAGTATERLDETHADQPVHGRRKGAGQRCQGEERHADQQRPAPPIAIGQRPVDQLTDGQADEIGRQRKLHVIDTGAERLRQQGERRQVHVDRQGTERAERAQYEKNPQGHQRLASWKEDVAG